MMFSLLNNLYVLASSPITPTIAVKDIIGDVSPPISGLPDDPITGLSRIFITGIQLTLLIAAIAVLIYLLWGAFEWINSGGEPDKVEAARSKMTHAVIGILVLVAALTIFQVVTGDILGIIRQNEAGEWIFKLPSIQDTQP